MESIQGVHPAKLAQELQAAHSVRLFCTSALIEDNETGPCFWIQH